MYSAPLIPRSSRRRNPKRQKAVKAKRGVRFESQIRVSAASVRVSCSCVQLRVEKRGCRKKKSSTACVRSPRVHPAPISVFIAGDVCVKDVWKEPGV